MAPALSLPKARERADYLTREARRRGMHPVVIVITDDEGAVLADSGTGTVGSSGYDNALFKTLAARVYGRDTRDVGHHNTARPHPGGVLLRSGDTIVGMVGVYYNDSSMDHELATSRPTGWKL